MASWAPCRTAAPQTGSDRKPRSAGRTAGAWTLIVVALVVGLAVAAAGLLSSTAIASAPNGSAGVLFDYVHDGVTRYITNVPDECADDHARFPNGCADYNDGPALVTSQQDSFIRAPASNGCHYSAEPYGIDRLCTDPDVQVWNSSAVISTAAPWADSGYPGGPWAPSTSGGGGTTTISVTTTVSQTTTVQAASSQVTLGPDDRHRADLAWWGVWAAVGLILVGLITPFWRSAWSLEGKLGRG